MHLRFLALAALILLLGGTAVSSQTQRRVTGSSTGILPNSAERYESEVYANEVSAGTIDRSSTVYGWTFSGNSKGDLSGPLFMSVNYSKDIAGVGVDSGVRFEPLTLNNVIGGSWSKMIYVDGEYVGSMSGTVVGGNLSWNADHTSATVELQMVCDNGTESFAGVSGVGSFSGTLDRSKDGTVSGTLVLNY